MITAQREDRGMSAECSHFKLSGPICRSEIDRLCEFQASNYYKGKIQLPEAAGLGELIHRKIADPYDISTFCTSFPYVWNRSLNDIRNQPVSIFQVKLIKRGSIDFWHGGMRFSANPGDIVLCRMNVPEMQRFAGRNGEKHEIDYFHVSQEVVHAHMPDIIGRSALIVRGSEKSRAVGAIFELMREHGNSLDDGEITALIKAILAIVAKMAAEGLPHGSSMNCSSKQADHILSFIRANYSNSRLNVADICVGVGVSSRCINRVMAGNATTFQKYLLELRLNAARLFLNDPKTRRLKLFEISQMCGFGSYPHFSDTFRRSVGVSPRQFRNDAHAD